MGVKKNLLAIIFACLSLNTFSQVTNSVLASGNWYKVTVAGEGIYQLGYADFQALGINVSSIDPRNIRMYGNGGGMLPVANYSPRPNDLTELAITVTGESDGTFDAGDKVLFYGQSQHRWHFDATDNRFHHTVNIYTDSTSYFLTVGVTAGKRITPLASSSLIATDSVTTFDDFAFHEVDSLNFLKSGENWYGEEFDQVNNSHTFSFNFPNHVDTFYVKSVPIARSINFTSHFDVSVNGNYLMSEWAPSVPDLFFGTYAAPCSTSTSIRFIAGDNFNLNLKYIPNAANPQATGWLNYIEINGRRLLSKSSSQFFFRDKNSVGPGQVSDFTISNTTVNDLTWDITDQGNVKQIQTSFSSGNTSMRLPTDSLKSFVTFDPSSALIPVLNGTVANQNLHALPQAQLIIITHPAFLSAANNLANQHRTFDGMTVNVATTDQIYNEFSSGAQDVSALRDFISMFYNRAVMPSDSPRYVLLFGVASYDYKNRLAGNTNYVPTYESTESLNPTSSFSTDDYFAWLDNNANADSLSNINVEAGVGRLPVRSLAEANAMVNKISHYQSFSAFGNWRKNLAFVADDEDEDIHILQTDASANYDDTAYCNFDQTKIYLDAYHQLNGNSYPDVNNAINATIDSGCLIMAYTGHGGPRGWAEEQVLTQPMINAWNNLDKQAFFVSVTSEFNIYDDPADTSAGESILLNPAGGGIASWAGTALAFSQANFDLKKKFDLHALQQVNGQYNRIGDIVRLAKSEFSALATINVTLLGDPAVQLHYPAYNAVLTTLNGNPVHGTIDTLYIGNTVTATGEIQDAAGSPVTAFSGKIHILLLGQQTDNTLANDPQSYVTAFKTWRDTLYNGNATVTNGVFSLSFTPPNTTGPYFQSAKFSFYATNGTTDASGCYTGLVAGNILQGIASFTDPLAGVSVFPNPASDVVMFRLNTLQPSPFNFYLYDVAGRKEKTLENIPGPDFNVKVNDLAKGMYLFTIENNKQAIISRGKLIAAGSK